MAQRWWTTQLRPARWMQCTPPDGNQGNQSSLFIPIQYKIQEESSASSHVTCHRGRGSRSSRDSNNKRQSQYIQDHGKEGVHYADGQWFELFHLVRRYATFRVSSINLDQYHQPHYIIEDYDGPRLGRSVSKKKVVQTAAPPIPPLPKMNIATSVCHLDRNDTAQHKNVITTTLTDSTDATFQGHNTPPLMNSPLLEHQVRAPPAHSNRRPLKKRCLVVLPLEEATLQANDVQKENEARPNMMNGNSVVAKLDSSSTKKSATIPLSAANNNSQGHLLVHRQLGKKRDVKKKKKKKKRAVVRRRFRVGSPSTGVSSSPVARKEQPGVTLSTHCPMTPLRQALMNTSSRSSNKEPSKTEPMLVDLCSPDTPKHIIEEREWQEEASRVFMDAYRQCSF